MGNTIASATLSISYLDPLLSRIYSDQRLCNGEIARWNVSHSAQRSFRRECAHFLCLFRSIAFLAPPCTCRHITLAMFDASGLLRNVHRRFMFECFSFDARHIIIMLHEKNRTKNNKRSCEVSRQIFRLWDHPFTYVCNVHSASIKCWCKHV